MVRSSWLLRWWIIIWTKISFSGGWHCLGNLKNPMIHLTILITQIRYLPLSLGYLVASCDHGRWMWWFWFCQTSKVLVQENSKLSKKNFSACVFATTFFFQMKEMRDEEPTLKNSILPIFYAWMVLFFLEKKSPKKPLWTWPPSSCGLLREWVWLLIWWHLLDLLCWRVRGRSVSRWRSG